MNFKFLHLKKKINFKKELLILLLYNNFKKLYLYLKF